MLFCVGFRFSVVLNVSLSKKRNCFRTHKFLEDKVQLSLEHSSSCVFNCLERKPALYSTVPCILGLFACVCV